MAGDPRTIYTENETGLARPETRPRVQVIPFRGAKTGPLRQFKKVLYKWLDIMKNYEWLEYKDAPWWYNERASLSFFAGAIWKCKGWAFEEYATNKGPVKRRGRQRQGRGDIYFSINGNEYVAEAKQCWSSMKEQVIDIQKRRILKSLSKARKDSSMVPNYDARRLGIVFVSPWLPVSKKEDVEKCIRMWLREVLTIPDSAIAWIFPKNTRTLRGSDKCLYPGVVLVIRPLKLNPGRCS